MADWVRLRRAFVLIDGSHGIKKIDEEALALLRESAIPHQIILSKVDKLLSKSTKNFKSGIMPAKIPKLKRMLGELRPIIQPGDGHPGALGEIVTCSSDARLGKRYFVGINTVRWAILSAAGFDGTMKV